MYINYTWRKRVYELAKQLAAKAVRAAKAQALTLGG
ncbi:hypothetical protein BOSP111201_13150 [Bordetella sputigena]